MSILSDLQNSTAQYTAIERPSVPLPRKSVGNLAGIPIYTDSRVPQGYAALVGETSGVAMTPDGAIIEFKTVRRRT